MEVHYDITNLPLIKNAVLTIGTFDGVHLGHLQILNSLKEEAQKLDGTTLIITFYPHPRNIIKQQQSSINLINTLPERIQLLSKCGIDHLVIMPFTPEFAEMTATSFVEDFIIKYFHPSMIIIGYDHHFGLHRAGNFQLLETYSKQGEFILKEIPAHLLEESSISATRIRTALQQGDLPLAKQLLGYEYFFQGTVVEGNKIGRTLGYPTANLVISDSEKLVPSNGVYAVEVEWIPKLNERFETSTSARLQGMMNIGYRPTVNGSQKVIEVHIFNFNETIYGDELRVHLKSFIRKERKFDGLDALKHQLAQDKLDSIAILTV